MFVRRLFTYIQFVYNGLQINSINSINLWEYKIELGITQGNSMYSLVYVHIEINGMNRLIAKYG